MTNHRIYSMSFAKLYPCYTTKAEKKGRTTEEVNQLITWLTGYTQKKLEKLIESDISVQAFFEKAPRLNPLRKLIKGTVCGVQVEEVEDPIMREIRYLDKLIDELARGRAMEKILRTKE